MSSMKRYLSAFLAIVMLLSLFTGALSEEAIEALTAEGEAALAAVAADAASDEDEVIAAGDEDQAVGEVGEMELPSDDGADDTAAAPAAGEDDGLEIIPEEPAEAPADDAGEAPADDADGEPADDADGEPADDADGEPADDADGEPADDADGEPADDAGEEPTDDADGEPTDDAGEEPTDDVAEEPADDAAEEPTDDAEDPDFMGLFASSEDPAVVDGDELHFPTRIDVSMERNGEAYGDGCTVIDTDRLQFYADVFPRNALNPGIFWSVNYEEDNEGDDQGSGDGDGEPGDGEGEPGDEDDEDDEYHPAPRFGISSTGLLTVRNVYEPIDLVVTASTVAHKDSDSQFTPEPFVIELWPQGFYIDEYASVRDDDTDDWVSEDELISNDKYYYTDGTNNYQIVNLEEGNGDGYGAVMIDGETYLVEYSESLSWDSLFVFIYDIPDISADFRLTVLPHATGIKIFQKLEGGSEKEIKSKDLVSIKADEEPQFRVEVTPAGAMPGFSVENASYDLVPYWRDIGYNEVNYGEDENASFSLKPVYTEDEDDDEYDDEDGDEPEDETLSTGESAYRITSGDGRVSTTLRVYRNAGEIESISLVDGLKTPAVELGIKKKIDLTDYIVPLFNVQPEGAKYELVFTTSATKIIGLTEDGVVTGKKAGTANVTVAVKGYPDVKTTLQIAVKKKAVNKVSIGGPKVRYLAKSGTVKLAASVSPKGASTRLYWYSDDEEIATVDQNGNVTRTGYGETNIWAFSMDGSYCEAKVEIRCCDPVADINPYTEGFLPNMGWWDGYQDETSGLVIGVKARAELKASLKFASQAAGIDDETVIDYDALDEMLDYYRYYGLTFTTDKKGKKIINISRDSYGKTYITGKKAGTATVTARSEDGFCTKPFKVTVVKPVKVAMGLKNASGEAVTDRIFNLEDIGALQGTLYPSVTPAANKVNNEIVTFTSTNDDVAYVDYDEYGTPYLYFEGQPGTTTIKAYLRDFVSVGSISITVFEPIDQLKFKDEDKYADPGDNQTLRVYEVAKGKKIKLPMPDFQPATSQVDLTWETSNKAVATVKNGVVTGKKAGTVTITARSKVKPDTKDTLTVTVMPKPASKVTVTANGGASLPTAPANKFFFNINDENANYEAIQMSALVAPGAGKASQQVSWSAVDEDGYEVPITDGGVLDPELGWYGSRTITVTAAATDGSGKKGSAVLVFDDYVTGIQLYGNSPDNKEVWLAKGKWFDMYDTEPSQVVDPENDYFDRVHVRRASSGEFVPDGNYAYNAAWSVPQKAHKKIVSVDGAGSIYGKKAGTAVVRVADRKTGVYQTIRVIVYDQPTAVTIKGADNGVLHLHGAGDTATLTATVTGKKKQKVPGGVFWFADGEGVEVDLNSGVVKVTETDEDGYYATVYAVPRVYDLTYVVPENAVVGTVEVRVTPDVDEVRVFGSHSVAVNRATKLVGRTYTDGGMAEDQRITWSVKPGYEDIVSIEEKTGVVKGKKAGRAYVLATAVGVQPGSEAPVCQFYVDVTEPIKKMTIMVNGGIYYPGLDYNVNDMLQLSVLCEPFNANPDVTWSSSDTGVLVVDNNGVVKQSPKLKKLKSPKKAVITATAQDKATRKKLTAKITVWIYPIGE